MSKRDWVLYLFLTFISCGLPFITYPLWPEITAAYLVVLGFVFGFVHLVVVAS